MDDSCKWDEVAEEKKLRNALAGCSALPQLTGNSAESRLVEKADARRLMAG